MNIKKTFNGEGELVGVDFDVNLIDEHKLHFEKFSAMYEIDDLYLHPSKRPKLKSRIERTCRYCGNKVPTVTFKKTAHIIPELMGNRNVISDFECDTCNQKFSLYEDSLANFLGLARTISNAKGKVGVPTFKSLDKKLEARKNPDTGGIMLTVDSLDSDYVILDENKRKLTIKASRHPYKPILVYKALLKIAIGLLPENEIENYKDCLIFLESDLRDTDNKDNPYLGVCSTFCPGPAFLEPTSFLWRRKNACEPLNIPYRSMVIYFQNFSFQIFLPFGKLDESLNRSGNSVTFNFVPPLLDAKRVQKFGIPTYRFVNLSDTEIRLGEEHAVTMTFYDELIKTFPGH